MVTETSNNTSDAEASSAKGKADQVQDAAPTPSAEEVLQLKVKELEQKLQESEKKYLYLYSEFENFRRRNERERLDYLKYGHEGFLRDLLQVLDNFERALSHAKGLNSEKGSPLFQVCQGIEMIHFQMLEAIKAQGVQAIKTEGAAFDPAFHEAVSEEVSNGDAGKILREVQKGYQLHGRLLRAARVVISKK